MSNAARDDNFIPSKLAVLNTDTIQGTTLVPIQISSGGFILMDEVATISFTMKPVSPRDKNYEGCWLFKGTNGKTYPAVATSTGKILVDTT